MILMLSLINYQFNGILYFLCNDVPRYLFVQYSLLMDLLSILRYIKIWYIYIVYTQ